MNEPVLIAGQKEFDHLMGEVALVERVGFDTESNSFHAYHERLCLLQLTLHGRDYVIDPFAVEDFSPLQQLLENEGVLKIMHGAEYDVLLLKRTMGAGIRNLFDTQRATRILGWSRSSLAHLVSAEFGVDLDKSLQRHNWARRPLTQEQLCYAAMDTHYLEELFVRLSARLSEAGLLGKAREQGRAISAMEPRPKVVDLHRVHTLPGYKGLNQKGRELAQTIYEWREGVARDHDLAPFRVLRPSSIVRLASAKPRTMAELYKISQLNRRLWHRYGQDLLKVVRTGHALLS